MRGSLLILTALAVFMSGCAQKGSITLYAPQEKIVANFATVLFLNDNSIKECKDGDSIVTKSEFKNTRYDVPIAFTTKTFNDTNTTSYTLENSTLNEGSETVLKACFTDSSHTNVELFFTKKIIEVKPVITFDQDGFSCTNMEMNENHKIVTCNQK